MDHVAHFVRHHVAGDDGKRNLRFLRVEGAPRP